MKIWVARWPRQEGQRTAPVLTRREGRKAYAQQAHRKGVEKRHDEHATYTTRRAADKTARVAYPSLEEVRPSELGDECGEDVAECDDALRRGWWYEVERGGEDDHVEYWGTRLRILSLLPSWKQERLTIVDQPEEKERQPKSNQQHPRLCSKPVSTADAKQRFARYSN